MKPKTAGLLSVAALCFGATTGASTLWAQKYPPPFPREAARMLFENDRVEVWDVTWPKGQPTAMHEHPADQLSVTLVGGTKRVTRLGATPTVGKSERGQVVFTPKGTVHMEEGVSDVPERKIMIQVKGSAANPAAEVVPREGAIKLLENARVIVWDYTWKPGETASVHADNRDSVLVFLDGGTIRSDADQKGSNDSVRRADEVVYSPHSTDRKSEKAIQGSPRAIIVELK